MIEFMLTGKLVCGHCGCSMVGDSGTGKSGVRHHYYSCISRKRNHSCSKNTERQIPLEIAIVQETIRHVLQPDVISDLVDRAMDIYERDLQEDPVLLTLQAEKKSVDTSLRNLLRAIEDGLYTPTTKKRLEELEQQQSDLSSRISVLQASRPQITRDHVLYFLESFRDGDVNDPDYRRRVIDALVHSVTIFDGPDPTRKIRIIYNLTDHNTSTADITASDLLSCIDGFGCSADSSTIPRPSEHLSLYLSAGLFVLDVTIKAPE